MGYILSADSVDTLIPVFIGMGYYPIFCYSITFDTSGAVSLGEIFRGGTVGSHYVFPTGLQSFVYSL